MSLSFEQIAQAFWWSLGATELFVAVFVALAFLLCAIHSVVLRDSEDPNDRDWRETLS
jgi:hypothetical protein